MFNSAPINKYRIFTVEDDEDDRDFLQEAFAENGCIEELRHFFTYEALFQHIDTLPDEKLPQLIILDNQVQGAYGSTALETIKSNPRLSNVKLALYSSCLQASVKSGCISHGVNLCLEKGNSLQAIKDHVSRFCLLLEE
jgi:CheY-like chemotaxis protein